MSERRTTVRQKSFMLGRVMFNRRQSSMDCLIRDFTKVGAHLHFPETAALPDAFEIYVPSKDEHFQARAIWHKGSDVGIAWILSNRRSPNLDWNQRRHCNRPH